MTSGIGTENASDQVMHPHPSLNGIIANVFLTRPIGDAETEVFERVRILDTNLIGIFIAGDAVEHFRSGIRANFDGLFLPWHQIADINFKVDDLYQSRESTLAA